MVRKWSRSVSGAPTVCRNYLFHNASYSNYGILIYLEHIHVYITPKSSISTFVKRCIKKYMYKCCTKIAVHLDHELGRGGYISPACTYTVHALVLE